MCIPIFDCNERYQKRETRLWVISGNTHDPLDHGSRLLELTVLSLDKSRIEVFFFFSMLVMGKGE